MPIYEYECTGCNHHFDIIQKMNDTPIKTCPECHEDKAIRLVSAAGFQLKGQGWYATDFKTKTKKSDTDASSDAAPITENPHTEVTKAAVAPAPKTTTGSESA